VKIIPAQTLLPWLQTNIDWPT